MLMVSLGLRSSPTTDGQSMRLKGTADPSAAETPPMPSHFTYNKTRALPRVSGMCPRPILRPSSREHATPFFPFLEDTQLSPFSPGPLPSVHLGPRTTGFSSSHGTSC